MKLEKLKCQCQKNGQLSDTSVFMEQIIDLHIHSKYARACSNRLEVPLIAEACRVKGIDIVSTGDFTHPAWFRHLEESLEEIGNTGLYQLSSRLQEGSLSQNLQNDRDSSSARASLGMTKRMPVRFIFGTEVACIYKDKDKVRRVHLLLYAPNIEAARKLNKALDEYGVNRASDGRPIFGMTSKELLKMMFDIDPTMMMIPAHAWTPWFAIFGSKSGYDTIEECFEELTPEIFAIETGLSSDPPMNHRLSKLDNIVLVSNSDAHSLENLGREANVFNFENEKEITYQNIRNIIKSGDKKKFLYTIEFHPEEGMYHVDGHRLCKVKLNPDESKKLKDICPVCKKKLTVGVLHRVDDLADRSEQNISHNRFIPHRYIVPLREIIAASFDVGKGSKKVIKEYEKLTGELGNEFYILLKATESQIESVATNPNIARGISNMRNGLISVEPGYDGVYGTVDLFKGLKYTGSVQTSLL